MPSQKPFVGVRLSEELAEAMRKEIEIHNRHPTAPAWDTMAFLRAAITEFIRKRKASRKYRDRETEAKADGE